MDLRETYGITGAGYSAHVYRDASSDMPRWVVRLGIGPGPTIIHAGKTPDTVRLIEFDDYQRASATVDDFARACCRWAQTKRARLDDDERRPSNIGIVYAG